MCKLIKKFYLMIIRNLNRLNLNYLINIFVKNFSLDGYINFGSTLANKYFIKKIIESKFYLEIGAGNSTLLADSFNKLFFSIETSKNFFYLVKKRIKKKNNIKFFNLGIVGEYSYPIFIYKSKSLKYIKFIEKFLKLKKFPDLILVDGRYRVLILIELFKYKKKIIDNDTCILLDDYQNRSYYKILNKLYLIKKIGRMAQLTPKKDFVIKNKDLFENYYYDSR